MSSFRLATEVQPGKPRDPYLAQQMSQIEGAVNSVNDLLTIVSGIWAVTAVEVDYAASFTDTAIFVDSTSADVTITLPAIAQGVPAGKAYAVRNHAGANLVHVIQVLPDLSFTQLIVDLAAGQSVLVSLGPGTLGYGVF